MSIESELRQHLAEALAECRLLGDQIMHNRKAKDSCDEAVNDRVHDAYVDGYENGFRGARKRVDVLTKKLKAAERACKKLGEKVTNQKSEIKRLAENVFAAIGQRDTMRQRLGKYEAYTESELRKCVADATAGHVAAIAAIEKRINKTEESRRFERRAYAESRDRRDEEHRVELIFTHHRYNTLWLALHTIYLGCKYWPEDERARRALARAKAALDAQLR